MINRRYLLAVTIPLHIFTLIGVWVLPFELIDICLLFIGYVLIGGLGVNVGLHRWASHRSVQITSTAKKTILLFSTLACQGHPLWWAAVHRNHHRYSDTKKDYHSPVNTSNWHAFFGWIIQHDPTNVNLKRCPDLLKDKTVLKFHRMYYIIVWCTWITFALIAPHILVWMLLVPAVIALHSEGLVNAFCHGKQNRNFNTNDSSNNNIFLGWLDWGNGWHNNHHYRPGSYNFGYGVSGKKTEFDPCVIFLPFIAK